MGGSSVKKRVPSEERVFSLVLALVASPQGLTKSDLLTSVYGYAGRYKPGHVDPALERQFDRDKSQLRQLGIPIDTIDSPQEPGNNQLTRYRISKNRLQLPEDVQFSADELTLLNLASLAWSEGSLGDQSRWASMKIASLGTHVDLRHLGISPRVGLLEPAAPALQTAIDEGRVAHFDYRLPGMAAPLLRRVAPLRLHRAEGRWHLIAFDLDREDDRVFLLTRIESEVRVTAEEYAPELRQRVGHSLDQLLGLKEKQRATVVVHRGSVAEARLQPRSTSESPSGVAASELELGTLDFTAFAAELAGYGDQVQVESPAKLRDGVLETLGLIRAQHAVHEGGADG